MESLETLRAAATGLAFASVRFVYWKSGAAQHDPHMKEVVKSGYWEGVRSRWHGWGGRGVKSDSEDLPS